MVMIRSFLICMILCLYSCASPELSDKKSEDTPDDMVLIPSGTFTMGGKSKQASSDELPRHSVSVSSFYMDETEVTNSQFETFVKETGYITIAERGIDWEQISQNLPIGTPKPPDSILKAGSLVFSATSGPVDLTDYSQWWHWKIGASWKQPEGAGSNLEGRMNHPVVHVAWEDAKAYAEWAGKRLPTEAEWEWASMGGLENPIYPWGNESVERAYDKANFWQGLFPWQNKEEDGFYGSAPVKSYPANGYGLYDMAGNVWEWCADKYRSDAYQRRNQSGVSVNPQGPSTSFDPSEPYTEKYSLRGGSFLCNDSYCSGYRVSRRMKSSRDTGMNHTGFRCVKSL